MVRFQNIIILLLFISINSYLIGVDIGSEFFKICVIKPGKPFMIVENFQSKMKTPTAISLKDDEIIYGADALNKKVRFPKNAFTYFENFLGETYESEFVKEFLENYLVSYDLEEDGDRHTISFKIEFNKKSEKICIEEIYGMLFTYIKKMSESFAKIEITDAYITIPSFFTYKQREALAQGIKMSKLTIDGFVSENLAAAVQFQLKKIYNDTQFVIFYNMGGSYTQASLVSYKTVYQEKNNKTIDLGNEIKVLSESWNKKIGGNTFNNKLINLLMKKFDELPVRKGKNSVKNNKKVYEKLLPYAIKCKEVLSANKDCYVTILGIDQGDNLECSISRDEFLEESQEIISEIYKPIETVLKQGNISLDNISSIELIGGSIRIPKVQEEIKEKLGEKYENLLGAHMNGDDSMAFGVAYMAANASRNFKGSRRTFMQNGANAEYKIYINEYNISKDIIYCEDKKEENKEIPINKESVVDSNNGNNNNNNITNTSVSKNEKLINLDCVHPMKKNTTLMHLRYDFGKTRKVSFSHDNDINVTLTETMLYENKENEIAKYSITGINDLCKYLIKEEITNVLPKIVLRFDYSPSGQIELEAYGEYEEELYMGLYLDENGKEICEYRRNFTEKLSEKEIEEINKTLNNSKVLTDYEYNRREREKLDKKMRKIQKKLEMDLKKNETLKNVTDNSTTTNASENKTIPDSNSTVNNSNNTHTNYTNNTNSTNNTNKTSDKTSDKKSDKKSDKYFSKKYKYEDDDDDDDDDDDEDDDYDNEDDDENDSLFEEKEHHKNKKDNKTENITQSSLNNTNLTVNLTSKKKMKQQFISESQKKFLLSKKLIGDKKLNIAKHPFKVIVYYSYPKPLNETQLEKSKKKIKNYFEIDENRIKLIEKKNTFETVIYDMKEWIESKEASLFMNDTEFTKAKSFLQNKSDWYEEDGYLVDLKTLEKELLNISNHFRKFERRRQNYISRYEALTKFYDELNQTNNKVHHLLNSDPWRFDYYNKTFVPEVSSILKWMNESIIKQDNMSLMEEPFLTADKIKAKGDAVRKAFYDFKQQKKPKPPKDLNATDFPKNDGDLNLEDLMKNSNFTKEEWEKIHENIKMENDKNNTNNTNNTNMGNGTKSNIDDLYPDDEFDKGEDDKKEKNENKEDKDDKDKEDKDDKDKEDKDKEDKDDKDKKSDL